MWHRFAYLHAPLVSRKTYSSLWSNRASLLRRAAVLVDSATPPDAQRALQSVYGAATPGPQAVDARNDVSGVAAVSKHGGLWPPFDAHWDTSLDADHSAPASSHSRYSGTHGSGSELKRAGRGVSDANASQSSGGMQSSETVDERVTALLAALNRSIKPQSPVAAVDEEGDAFGTIMSILYGRLQDMRRGHFAFSPRLQCGVT